MGLHALWQIRKRAFRSLRALKPFEQFLARMRVNPLLVRAPKISR